MLQKEYKISKKQAELNTKANEEEGIVNENDKPQETLLKAVKGVSFSVKKDECFILLGVNGAGKTTTFKCLVADENSTSGQIRIAGTKVMDLFGNTESI